MARRFNCIFLLLATVAQIAVPVIAQQPAAPPIKKVLLIGIDGCRFDAVRAADAPHIDALIEHGALAQPIRIFPERYRGADTISGPGWSNILTGVWADKHGVLDNEFKIRHYDKFPHFFTLLKQVQPQAYTASLADWDCIYKYIVSDADINTPFPLDEKEKVAQAYAAEDAKVAEAAVKILDEQDPTALFVYFGQVDETGHADGFHPSVPTYVAAIERVDGHIAQVLKAMSRRPHYAQEDWLVLVTTDHGGQGTSHSKGHDDPDVACSWLIVSGPSAEAGKRITDSNGQVDVVPTALAHLGVKIDPKWQLDGRPVGLKSLAAE